MSIDIQNLSAKELGALIAKANQRQKQLKKRKPIVGVRKRIQAIARESGYTIAELFGMTPALTVPVEKASRAPKKAKKSRNAGVKVEPKYRNPENPDQTWAARGKQPRWLAAEIAKGRTLAEFAIK